MKFIEQTKQSKFMTRKWNIVSDQSNANMIYDVGNKFIYNAEVLKYNPFSYNDT